jgi:hypothetical protein
MELTPAQLEQQVRKALKDLFALIKEQADLLARLGLEAGLTERHHRLIIELQEKTKATLTRIVDQTLSAESKVPHA